MNAVKLHEAGINATPGAGEAPGDGRDQFLLEPFDRARPRQHVDLGRIDPRIERSGHQGQAARLGRIAVLRHDRGRGQRGHGRLAHRHHVRAGPRTC